MEAVETGKNEPSTQEEDAECPDDTLESLRLIPKHSSISRPAVEQT